MLILLIITALALIAFLLADRRKTLTGLKKSRNMFLGILPVLLNVLILVSIALYLVPKETLVKWLGANSGMAGQLKAFVEAGGAILACGTCLKSRHLNGSDSCPISTRVDCVKLVEWADKTITF